MRGQRLRDLREGMAWGKAALSNLPKPIKALKPRPRHTVLAATLHALHIQILVGGTFDYCKIGEVSVEVHSATHAIHFYTAFAAASKVPAHGFQGAQCLSSSTPEGSVERGRC